MIHTIGISIGISESMMKRCARLLTSVPAERQLRFAQLAASRGLSSSRLLAMMVEAVLTKHALAADTKVLSSASSSGRGAASKYTLRLQGQEAALLEQRAQIRGMQPSSYVAQVLRAHLRKAPPLPYKEFRQIKRLVNELAGSRALLIEFTRRTAALGEGDASVIDAVGKLLPVLKTVRDDVHRMLVANSKSWEVLNG